MGKTLKDWVDKTHPINRAVFDDRMPAGTKTLIVSARKQLVPREPVTQDDNFVLQLELKNERSGTYARRFALGPWCSFTFGVEPFQSFTIWILHAPSLTGGNDFNLVVEASDGEEAEQQLPLLYPETLTTSGVWGVPWGAYELLPANDDPGFTWHINDVSGGVVSIAAPALAGQPQPVQGLRYETSVLFTGIWRIRP